jgi:hypothetical protein
MARRVRVLIPVVLPHGPFSDTTTIALIGREAKRERGCASVGPRRVSCHTKTSLSRADKSFIFNTFCVALSMPFPLSQDIAGLGGHHDRHAEFCDSRCNYPFCRGRRRGVQLDAVEGDVCFDAAGDRTARGCAHSAGARDYAVGAGLRRASVSEVCERAGGASPSSTALG